MKKIDAVKKILGDRMYQLPRHQSAKAYAPTNIALCKYWGKRNQELNLPVTSSLSISLGDKGALTELTISHHAHDLIFLNNHPVKLTTSFGHRLVQYLDLFRAQGEPHFVINIETNIPIAAGLASSACGFAALAKALNQLYGWRLTDSELSILARLGSGSASRSIWQGFVIWHEGKNPDGMDSYAEPIPDVWAELCVGLLIFSEKEKAIGSRDAMRRTVATSSLYSAWPAKVMRDMTSIKQALSLNDFELLGKTAESNAMSMHATMLGAWPPITYMLPETLEAMRKVWQMREENIPVYFTQDAGPNLKLLFLQDQIEVVRSHFSNLEIVQPFMKSQPQSFFQSEM